MLRIVQPRFDFRMIDGARDVAADLRITRGQFRCHRLRAPDAKPLRCAIGHRQLEFDSGHRAMFIRRALQLRSQLIQIERQSSIRAKRSAQH